MICLSYLGFGSFLELFIEVQFVFHNFDLDRAIYLGQAVEGALADRILEGVGVDDVRMLDHLSFHSNLTVC